MDKYEQLEELAKRLIDLELAVEDLESSAATAEENAELLRLTRRRDELRASVDALQAELHRLAVERLLAALAAGA